MNTWNTKAQDATLLTAECRGEMWTPDEVDFIAKNTETMTDEAIAKHLERTLYGVWGIQHRLRQGPIDFSAGKSRAAQVRPLSNRTYTFIGDDVPPGWND